MLHVTLIACGRLKERYLRDAVEEYSKRLSGYVKLDIREVADGPDMMRLLSQCRSYRSFWVSMYSLICCSVFSLTVAMK